MKRGFENDSKKLTENLPECILIRVASGGIDRTQKPFCTGGKEHEK